MSQSFQVNRVPQINANILIGVGMLFFVFLPLWSAQAVTPDWYSAATGGRNDLRMNRTQRVSSVVSMPVVVTEAPPLKEILTVSQPIQIGLPIRIKIPKLNLDAPVNQVGLTSAGAMDVPKDLASVGWYNLGPRPGEPGSAVLDGHYEWKNGVDGIFENLHILQVGDTLLVENTQSTITFVVRDMKLVDAQASTGDIFTSHDGVHLNLITCAGVWNQSEGTYSQRLIVFTDRVSDVE